MITFFKICSREDHFPLATMCINKERFSYLQKHTYARVPETFSFQTIPVVGTVNGNGFVYQILL